MLYDNILESTSTIGRNINFVCSWKTIYIRIIISMNVLSTNQNQKSVALSLYTSPIGCTGPSCWPWCNHCNGWDVDHALTKGAFQGGGGLHGFHQTPVFLTTFDMLWWNLFTCDTFLIPIPETKWTLQVKTSMLYGRFDFELSPT